MPMVGSRDSTASPSSAATPEGGSASVGTPAGRDSVDAPKGRVSPERYRTFVAIAAVSLAGIILTGAAVRLTGSGLGCEDWPTCSENRVVPELGLHAWIEFGNRLLSGVVGIAVGAAVLTAYRRSPVRRDLIRWAWGLVAGVVAQILLGGLTVIYDLHPLFVSGHYLLSIVLMWNVIVLYGKATTDDEPIARVDAPTLRLSRVTVAWSVVVLMVGTLVTGTGPHSGDPEVDRLAFDIGTIVRIHSATAWVCVALVVALGLTLRRNGAPDLVRLASVSLAALVGQGAIGYLQYALGVPALLVELHVAGSVVVFAAVLWTHLSLFRPAPHDVAGIVPTPTT